MKSYTHFTQEERESLAFLLLEKKSIRAIATELGRSPSSVAREIHRNYSYGKNRYNPWRAYTLYVCRRKTCHRKYKILKDKDLKEYVINSINLFWSPEEISGRGKLDGYSISTSTIYRSVKRGLLPDIAPKTHLRQRGKKKQKKRNYNSVQPDLTIHERPDIIKNKERFGDYEGDTVYGAVGKGCLVTMVDRKSKLLIATISKSRDNEDMRAAFQRINEYALTNIHSITLDNGSEFANFRLIQKDLNTTIYFADPHSPWQRGLNENTNGILRFYFPKGYNFLNLSEEKLLEVVDQINSRPRKCLGFLSPKEFLFSCCT